MCEFVLRLNVGVCGGMFVCVCLDGYTHTSESFRSVWGGCDSMSVLLSMCACLREDGCCLANAVTTKIYQNTRIFISV